MPANKVFEESNSKDITETKQEPHEVEGSAVEPETQVGVTTEKELEDTEVDSSSVKNEKETTADESLADVESLPESQPEQPAKSSKSSKRSTERKSKSRGSRASKYDI